MTSALGTPHSAAELRSQKALGITRPTSGPFGGRRRRHVPGVEGLQTCFLVIREPVLRAYLRTSEAPSMGVARVQVAGIEPTWPDHQTCMALFSDCVRFAVDSRGEPYSKLSAHMPGSYPGVWPTLGPCDPEHLYTKRVPFGHGAGEGNRTPNILITKEVLYR